MENAVRDARTLNLRNRLKDIQDICGLSGEGGVTAKKSGHTKNLNLNLHVR